MAAAIYWDGHGAHTFKTSFIKHCLHITCTQAIKFGQDAVFAKTVSAEVAFTGAELAVLSGLEYRRYKPGNYPSNPSASTSPTYASLSKSLSDRREVRMNGSHAEEAYMTSRMAKRYRVQLK